MSEDKKSMDTSGKHPLMDLFIYELKSIYWIENHFLEKLARMEDSASAKKIKQAFKNQITKEKEHAGRIKEVFKILGIDPQEKECKPVAEMIALADEVITGTEENSMTRDMGLIMTGQKVAHFAVACYGGLIILAKTIGIEGVPEILKLTIQEEKAANSLLYSIAESHINLSASKEES